MKRKKMQTICKWKEVDPMIPEPNSICGLAIISMNNQILHGLRHQPSKGTNGWYIWKGEYRSDDNFFDPICIEHLRNHIEIDLTEYLELPPGFRFLIDGNNYVDVWYDEKLLTQN